MMATNRERAGKRNRGTQDEEPRVAEHRVPIRTLALGGHRFRSRVVQVAEMISDQNTLRGAGSSRERRRMTSLDQPRLLAAGTLAVHATVALIRAVGAERSTP